MDTVKQTRSDHETSSCSACRGYEEQNKKLQEEMQNLRSEIGMETAQVSTVAMERVAMMMMGRLLYFVQYQICGGPFHITCLSAS